MAEEAEGEGAVRPEEETTRQAETPLKQTEAHLPAVRSLEVVVP